MSEENVEPAHRPDASEQPKSKAPILIAAGALVALLVVVGLIAALVSRTGESGVPIDQTSAAVPPLELPIKINQLQRDPNAADPTVAPNPERAMDTVTAIYNINGEATLVVIAGRPVKDPAEMLAMVEARAIRQVGAGMCGREPTRDLDVCVVTDGDTAVLGGGLNKQSVDEIVAQSQSVLDSLPK